MSNDIFERERLYQVTIAVARTMLRQGLITEEEFVIIDTKMYEKYEPYLAALYPVEYAKTP